MAVEQHVGRPSPAAPLQEKLDRADAGLPDEVKRRYPIRSIAEIEAEHPNRWLAVWPTRIDLGNTRIIEARLVEVARGRRALERLLEPVLAASARRYPFTYFNYRRPGTVMPRAGVRLDDAPTPTP